MTRFCVEGQSCLGGGQMPWQPCQAGAENACPLSICANPTYIAATRYGVSAVAPSCSGAYSTHARQHKLPGQAPARTTCAPRHQAPRTRRHQAVPLLQQHQQQQQHQHQHQQRPGWRTWRRCSSRASTPRSRLSKLAVEELEGGGAQAARAGARALEQHSRGRGTAGCRGAPPPPRARPCRGWTALLGGCLAACVQGPCAGSPRLRPDRRPCWGRRGAPAAATPPPAHADLAKPPRPHLCLDRRTGSGA